MTDHYYGELPIQVAKIDIDVEQMMFYQDMLIKPKFNEMYRFEYRLNPFIPLINASIKHFIKTFGLERYCDSYVYLCAKRLFQPFGQSFNRTGWHCDGFLSNDINYVWSDILPTVFSNKRMELTPDHKISLKELCILMHEHEIVYPDNTLLCLNQYNIHRVADVTQAGIRTFFKCTFSDRQFNLKGNAINDHLDYKWEMKDRQIERNDPAQ